MPPRLTTALLARPLAAAGVSALAVFGALPAAADPTDAATPAQTDDVFRPSTAIFQPSTCVGDKQTVRVTLTNGSGASQTFLITSQGGTVSPASTTVPANQSTTLTLHASGARQSIFVTAAKGKSAGSMPLPGCTPSSSSTRSPSRSTSVGATGADSADSATSTAAGQAQPSPSGASSSAGSTASATDPSGADSSTDSASNSAPSSSSTGSTSSSTSDAASAAMPSQAAGSSTSNGPSPLMVTGGIVLAALGLMGGGVALFREFRK